MSSNLQVIDHYELLEVVGQGIVSTVYRAQDTRSQRSVALKLINAEFANDPEYQRRFLSQTKAISALSHPHIIPIYDVAWYDDKLYVVMELQQGGTLRIRLDVARHTREFLDLQEVVRLSRQVAQALDHAHSKNLLHRDVRPGNILMKTDVRETDARHQLQAVLADFSLAPRLELEDLGILPPPEPLVGTLNYMAPELFRGQPPDARADIYAFGVMLYELVTGRLAFQSDSPGDLILMHTQGEPEAVQSLRPDVPPALVSIIHRTMIKNPQDRYQSAGEIARELEALEKSIKPITHPKTWRTPVTNKVVPSGEVTQYDILPVLDRPPIPVDLLSEGDEDVLIVTGPDGVTWRMPFEKPVMLIGRGKECDLVLDSRAVSRTHAQIERHGDNKVTLTDLNSTNGIFVGDHKLARGATIEWVSSESLKIGPFWVTLRPARSPIEIERRIVLNAKHSSEARIGDKIGTLKLTPIEAVVEPGGITVMRVEIFNSSPILQRFDLSIDNLPEEWYTITALPFAVPNGSMSERSIAIHPPRTSSSMAGRYDFVLAVWLEDHPHKKVALTGTLHVVQYYEFESSVTPTPRGCEVTITNRGNSDRSYTIELREPGNTLIMLPSRARLDVRAGDTVVTPIQIRPKQAAWFGFERNQPLDVTIRTDGFGPRGLRIEYPRKPRLTWEMVVLLLLLLGLLLLVLINR